MNNQKELYNVKLNEKEMAFLELVCVSNGLTYPSTNDELISVLESKIPIGVSMAVKVRYYEQEITRMQILLRAYKVFVIQQKGKAILKADRQRRIERDAKPNYDDEVVCVCGHMQSKKALMNGNEPDCGCNLCASCHKATFKGSSVVEEDAGLIGATLFYCQGCFNVHGGKPNEIDIHPSDY